MGDGSRGGGLVGRARRLLSVGGSQSVVERAEQLVTCARDELEAGASPPGIRQAVAAALGAADDRFAAGLPGEAAGWFATALELAGSRVLHFDTGLSPLAEDPAGFTAAFRESVVAKLVRGARDGASEVSRRSQARASTTEAGGERQKTRLLIAYRRNADFLGEVIEHFDGHPAFESRTIDFEELPGLQKFRKSPAALAEQILAGRRQLSKAAERNFREHLDWADVVFVEWCTALAVLLTKIDPGDTRVVVRVHSYEVFTHWPHLVDWTRVDDVVFVSEHLRDLAAAAIPGLTEPGAPRLHVRTLAMDLRRMDLPKDQDARFTLALLGASKMVKDPLWAIEVLRRLREHDQRYRLLLIGGKFQDPSAATSGYADAFQQDLAELEPLGAVERIRYTDDVPGVLQQVGVVLSTSVRESFHIGLVEGAASGAVPVVRDWPFFPGAPRQLFPDEWVVETPEQAARRVLDLTADEETWKAAGQRASDHVIGKWDWSVVQKDWEALLRK